ncbi:MAG: SDR family oxidoreductase [Pseudomonadota bacterium]|nr:SDR family oxidoreductase [Pseudomonadota bacterium]
MKRGFILNTPPTLRKTALITGASAGIGRDYARYLAAEGYDLILTARRKTRLEEVARELSGAFGTQVTVLTADLTDPAAPTKLAADIRKKRLQVDYLVNNAGYQVPGFFDRVRWDVQRDMMQIMMTAVAELCHIFGPEMAARGFGRIVNISSVAAFVPGQAGGALYPSVKAFVLRLSQSLATEYQTAGVHVVAVCPGFTWSEFHDVVGNRAQMNKLPGFMWLDGPKVVSDAHNAVEAGRGPVVVNGWVYKVLATLLQIIPDNWVGRLAARGTRKIALRPEDARDKPVSPTPKGPTKKPAKKSNGKSSRTAKTPARKPAKRTGKQADNG